MAQPWNMRVIVRYDNLPKIGKIWRDEAAKLSEQFAYELADLARARAPVAPPIYEKYGFLRDSIKVMQRGSFRLQWMVVVEASYGRYVEFGTIRTRAQPFLIPAAELMMPRFESAMANMLDEVARRVA